MKLDCEPWPLPAEALPLLRSVSNASSSGHPLYKAMRLNISLHRTKRAKRTRKNKEKNFRREIA
jgi:hypothetical protein